MEHVLPDSQPIHIVTGTSGQQIDISPLIRELHGIDRRRSWTYPETQYELRAIASRLIAATGSGDAVMVLHGRLSRQISKAFRSHLLETWQLVAAECD